MHSVWPTSTRSPSLDERLGGRRRRAVERAHHRRLDRDRRRHARAAAPRRRCRRGDGRGRARRARAAARPACATVIRTPASSTVSSPTSEPSTISISSRMRSDWVRSRPSRAASSRSPRPRRPWQQAARRRRRTARPAAGPPRWRPAGLARASRSMSGRARAAARVGVGGRLRRDRLGRIAVDAGEVARACRPTPRPSAAPTARAAPPGRPGCRRPAGPAAACRSRARTCLNSSSTSSSRSCGAQHPQPGVEVGDQAHRQPREGGAQRDPRRDRQRRHLRRDVRRR